MLAARASSSPFSQGHSRKLFDIPLYGTIALHRSLRRRSRRLSQSGEAQGTWLLIDTYDTEAARKKDRRAF